MFKIQELRVVWFPADPMAGDAIDLFERLFGVTPDETSRVRSPTPQQPYLMRASGTIQDFEIEVQKQVGRLDLIMRKAEVSPGYAHRDSLDIKETFDFVVTSITRASDAVGICQRLSVVAALVKKTVSLDDARKEWSKYTNYDIGITNLSDHFLQVNRPSLIDEIPINRLVQAAVIAQQNVRLSMGPNGMFSDMVSEAYSFLATHDFNTALGNTVYHSDDQIRIFKGLISSIIDAAEVGNISFLGDGQ